MSEPTITFKEFLELCEDAGISTDDADVLEQDYRAGRALADVVDALITDQELHSDPYASADALDQMDLALSLLEEGEDLEAKRATAKKLAVFAIRFLAENLYDEGKN